MDLPKYSEEDGKTLRQLQIEFENISENIKKINQNNYYRKELESIDVHEFRRLLSENPDLIDTAPYLTGLGSWRSEAMHEQKMIDKYKDLAGMHDATCPTCDQEINQAFVQQEIKEHKMRYDQCLKFAAKKPPTIAINQRFLALSPKTKFNTLIALSFISF